jgi:hypothetical protein
MRFVRSVDGTHFVGISKTQAAHPSVQSGARPIHEPNPTSEKQLRQVPTYPGHARNSFGSAKIVDAGVILRDASNLGKKPK